MSTQVQEVPKATRREWVGLAVLALPCLLYSMDLTVLNLAVPKLSATLRPSGTEFVAFQSAALASAAITLIAAAATALVLGRVSPKEPGVASDSVTDRRAIP